MFEPHESDVMLDIEADYGLTRKMAFALLDIYVGRRPDGRSLNALIRRDLADCNGDLTEEGWYVARDYLGSEL